MKIIDIKTVLLTGPCTNDPYLTKCHKKRSAAFIEIYTDMELVGLGETYAGISVRSWSDNSRFLQTDLGRSGRFQ